MRRTLNRAVPAGLLALALAGWSGAAALAAEDGTAATLAAEDGTAATLAAEDGTAATLATTPATQAAMAANAPDHDDPADHAWSAADVIPITLNGTSATSTSSAVTINGGTVTVTAAGTYQLTGTLTNGQIAVNSPGTGIVRLILNGASITNSTSSAINVVAAGEVMVVLADGTTNTLTDASRYVYPDPAVDEPNAALFSTANLTIAGTGSLTVRGNAYDGITSKDGLVIASGTITVNAVDEGIRGKDYLVVNGGTITVTASGDGLRSNEDGDATKGYVYISAGTLRVTAGADRDGDAIQAETDIVISGGDTTVTSGGGSNTTVADSASGKGLKAGVSVVVGDGRVSADSADDAINSNGSFTMDGGTLNLATADDGIGAETDITVSAGTVTVTKSFEALEALRVTISGGTVTVTSRDDSINGVEEGIDEFANSPNAFVRISGGTTVVNSAIDGIDSNGSVTFSGGTVVVSGPASGSPGEGAIDANGPVYFTGGTVLGSGSTSMAVMSVPPTNGQGWAAPRFGTSQGANTVVHVVSNGQVLVSYRSPKNFQEIVFSANRITNGQSYDIYTGGTISGTTVGGMSTTGSISGATRVMSVVAGQYSGGLIGWPGGGGPGGPTTPPTTPPTASPTGSPGNPAGRTCTAAYTVTNQWTGGFQGSVRVTAGSSAISGWRVTWTFANGQTVSQSWEAAVTSSGSAVTAVNLAHNGALAAGASTTFGFIGSWTGSNAVPAVTCTAS